MDRTFLTALDLHHQPAQLAHTAGSTSIPKIVPLKGICLTQTTILNPAGDCLVIVSPSTRLRQLFYRPQRSELASDVT